jgi:hypothetical protein
LSLDIQKNYGVSEVMKFVRMTADWPMADCFKAPGGQRTKIELITLGCHMNSRKPKPSCQAAAFE